MTQQTFRKNIFCVIKQDACLLNVQNNLGMSKDCLSTGSYFNIELNFSFRVRDVIFTHHL